MFMPGPALISEEHLCVGVILPAVLLRKAFLCSSAKLDANRLCVFVQKYMPANKHSWKPGYLREQYHEQYQVVLYKSAGFWLCFISSLHSTFSIGPRLTSVMPP